MPGEIDALFSQYSTCQIWLAELHANALMPVVHGVGLR